MSLNRIVTNETIDLFNYCTKGDILKVKKLIKDPSVDINWENHDAYGMTALFAAIHSNQYDIVKILLENDADVSVVKIPDLNTPLHEACFLKNISIVKELLKLKNTTTRMDSHSWNMLEAKNQYGNTVLHMACMSGINEIIEALITAGCHLNEKNIEGSTPLHHACYADHYNVKVIETLVKAGADVNATDQNGTTPLIVAIKNNNKEIVQSLLEHHATIKLIDNTHHDCIYYAEKRNNPEIIQLLKK